MLLKFVLQLQEGKTKFMATSWKCPCTGCQKTAKQTKKDIVEFLQMSGYTDIALLIEEEIK